MLFRSVILDIEKFAKVAHEHEVPLIVDNTFATPVNCRPFEWGADIVTHSTTKYMDGHAVQVGGAIVDSGNFDWDAYGNKYHGLTEPDESYHGVIYTKQFEMCIRDRVKSSPIFSTLILVLREPVAT